MSDQQQQDAQFTWVSRTTRITAKVDDVEATPVHQPFHRDRGGKLMRPHAVEIIVTDSEIGSPVTVRVSGTLFRKDGSLGDARASALYETKGERYVKSLPLADLPDWLAGFVADQTKGLLSDAAPAQPEE